MSENTIFKITEVEGGVIVTEFERGNQRSISIDDYVAVGNDIQELFKDYFTKNPAKTSNLVFSDTDDPKQGSISYKNATIDVFDKKSLQSLINGEEAFLGLVSYKDILANTQELAPEKKKDEPEAKVTETITGISEDFKKDGLRGFINKHKVLTASILGMVLIISLLISISITISSAPPKIEVKDDLKTQYLNEKRQFLQNFGKKYGGNPIDAKIQIQLFLDELNKIKDTELSEKNRKTFDELLSLAEKYREAIDKK